MQQTASGLTALFDSCRRIMDALITDSGIAGLRQLKSEMEQLPAQLGEIGGTAAGSRDIERSRQTIADIRFHLNRIMHQLEQAERQIVEKYRTEAGETKERFESLDASRQRETNPGAYAAKQCFERMQTLKEMVNRIMGELMNMSDAMERSVVRRQRRKPPSGTPVPIIEDDASPPALSP